MRDRVRVLRLVIVLGYVLVGLGLAISFIGAYALVAMPLSILFLEPVFDWVVDARTTRRMTTGIRENGRDALTSDQMDWNFRERIPRVIDDDPAWGKLVEGRERVFNQNLTAVQVTNATPEPDGSFKKVWLRVPARGDRQGTRECMQCKRDISWPPRSAKEAIAWTFRMCEEHYQPAKAS